jgi:hypothetical protein
MALGLQRVVMDVPARRVLVALQRRERRPVVRERHRRPVEAREGAGHRDLHATVLRGRQERAVAGGIADLGRGSRRPAGRIGCADLVDRRRTETHPDRQELMLEHLVAVVVERLRLDPRDAVAVRDDVEAGAALIVALAADHVVDARVDDLRSVVVGAAPFLDEHVKTSAGETLEVVRALDETELGARPCRVWDVRGHGIGRLRGGDRCRHSRRTECERCDERAASKPRAPCGPA